MAFGAAIGRQDYLNAIEGRSARDRGQSGTVYAGYLIRTLRWSVGLVRGGLVVAPLQSCRKAINQALVVKGLA